MLLIISVTFEQQLYEPCKHYHEMNNMYHFLDQPNIVQVSLYNFKKVLIKYLCNKALLPSSKNILTVFVSRPQDIRNRYFQVLFLPFFFIIVQSH